MGEGFMGSFRVLDETMGRRTWPDEEKLRIVMESYVPGARVGDVARKYRLLPSQLTTWRRMAREGRFGLPPDVSGVPDVGAFVPLMLDGGSAAPQAIRDDRIEIAFGDVTIRLPATVSAAQLAEIAGALGARRG